MLCFTRIVVSRTDSLEERIGGEYSMSTNDTVEFAMGDLPHALCWSPTFQINSLDTILPPYGKTDTKKEVVTTILGEPLTRHNPSFVTCWSIETLSKGRRKGEMGAKGNGTLSSHCICDYIQMTFCSWDHRGVRYVGIMSACRLI